MSIEITYARVNLIELNNGFTKEEETFLTWLHESLPSYTLGCESSNVFQLLEDHDELCVLCRLGEDEIQHSSGFYANIIYPDEIVIALEAFNCSNLSEDDEFFDDFEEFVPMLVSLKDLFTEANKAEQVVIFYWM